MGTVTQMIHDFAAVSTITSVSNFANGGYGDLTTNPSGQVGGNFTKGILHPQQTQDRTGILFVSAGDGTVAGTVTLSHRIVQTDPVGGQPPFMDWCVITNADWNADPNFCAAKVFTMMNNLRVTAQITANVTGVLNVWVIE